MNTKKASNYEIDKLDREIISEFIKDGSIPYSDVAKKLIVSGGTIHVRMNRLAELGIVKGTELKLDYQKLGYDITAFIGIYLEKGSLYNKVAEELKKINEVAELHYTTGSYSMFAKLVCKNTHNLRDVLNEKVQSIKGIERTETFISLEESIKRQLVLEK
jgi:Lrp/AsnC family transcriptional regulator for asnA, asnC and gidA